MRAFEAHGKLNWFTTRVIKDIEYKNVESIHHQQDRHCTLIKEKNGNIHALVHFNFKDEVEFKMKGGYMLDAMAKIRSLTGWSPEDTKDFIQKMRILITKENDNNR